MHFALTLVSPDSEAVDAARSQVEAAVAGLGARIHETRYLGPNAIDKHIEGAGMAALRAAAEAAIADLPVDVCVQPRENRRKRLLVADMDSTIIGCECLDELADFAGKKLEIAAITERAMRGELAFEGALKERVGMLRGLGVEALQRCFDERVRLNPGARTLVGTMAANGARCVLVSGGFEFFTGRVAQLAGFQHHRANRLIEDRGALTGEVGLPILGREAKLEALLGESAAAGLDPSQVLAVGDGANDLAMIKAAGLGVAYRAKPIVAAEADARVDHADLTALLYFQGYPADAFVGGTVRLPRTIAAVVFDMDGLLLDSEVLVRAGARRAAERLGRDFPDELFASTMGCSDAVYIEAMRVHFGPGFPMDEFLALEGVEIERELQGGVCLKTGVVELVDDLDRLGVPRALATSSSRRTVERHLGPRGLLPGFKAIVAREDVTRHKPHPDPYLEAARRLGVAPQDCLALEDSHNGVRAAHAARMMTVMVPDLLAPTEEMRSLCVGIADTLHAVRRLIEGLETGGAAG